VPNEVDIDLNQESPPLVGNGWIFVTDDEGGVVGLQRLSGDASDPATR
jgi:hypothetical protein